MTRRSAAVLAVLAALALLAAAAAGVLFARSGESLTRSGPDETVVNDVGLALFDKDTERCVNAGQKDAWACMNDVVQKYATEYGTATTLAGMRRAMESNPGVFELNCHRNYHYIGEHSGKALADVDAALALGGPECQFGFYHGVIEGYAAVSEKLWEELPTLCDKITTDQTTVAYNECVHGLGHAVKTRTNDNVDEGIKYCRLLKQDFEVSACATGIFMSWSNDLDKVLARGEQPSGKYLWAPVDFRHKNCPQYDDVIARACMFYFAEIPTHTFEDLDRYRDWCDSEFADRPAVREGCHEGVGRIVGAYEEFPKFGEWPGVVKFCTADVPYEYAARCMQTAYVSAASFAVDPKMAEKACAAWKGSEHEAEQCELARTILQKVTADVAGDGVAADSAGQGSGRSDPATQATQ